VVHLLLQFAHSQKTVVGQDLLGAVVVACHYRYPHHSGMLLVVAAAAHSILPHQPDLHRIDLHVHTKKTHYDTYYHCNHHNEVVAVVDVVKVVSDTAAVEAVIVVVVVDGDNAVVDIVAAAAVAVAADKKAVVHTKSVMLLVLAHVYKRV
jgi:hypothetical protein